MLSKINSYALHGIEAFRIITEVNVVNKGAGWNVSIIALLIMTYLQQLQEINIDPVLT